jgi:pyruvate formate lyase activating enzyme
MFYPAYEFTDLPATSVESLRKAKQTGESNGLRYVYLGNVAADSNTYCPDCGQLLINRGHHEAGPSRLFDKGRCTFCEMEISGFW